MEEQSPKAIRAAAAPFRAHHIRKHDAVILEIDGKRYVWVAEDDAQPHPEDDQEVIVSRVGSDVVILPAQKLVHLSTAHPIETPDLFRQVVPGVYEQVKHSSWRGSKK